MITLETGQRCVVDPDWIVVTGGDYAPDALVDCRRADCSEQTCAYYAITIATGEYPQ